MQSELLKVIQNRQYNLLCEVKRICEHYHINYFLCCGTLLGCIRHGGPIPWDDDLDVGFLRKDYEKFLHVAEQELKPEFFLQTWDTDANYALPHGKLRDLSSHYIETVNKNSGCIDGISIDLLPFDSIPEWGLMQKLHGYYLFHVMNIIKVKRGWIFIKEDRVNIVFKLIYFLLANLHEDIYFIKKYSKVCQKYNGTSSIVSEAAGLDIFRFVEKKEMYESLISKEYKNSLFKIPKEYDVVLKNAYGVYGKLPSANMRQGQPGVEKVEVW